MTAFTFGAAIFDLDGVVTDTASVHADAWKSLFDDYLRACAARLGTPFRPFDAGTDYVRYVDGKPRYEGVRSFLAARGLELGAGDPSDSADRETVCGLGNRKDRLFAAILERDGVRAFEGTVSLIRQLRELGVPRAIASSSKNCRSVLERAGLVDLFDARVDGTVSAELGLPGKPAPDIFLACAERLGVPPARCVVVEDAVVGVEAGRAGGFGLVIGMDRTGNGEALRCHGADVVVSDFRGVGPADVDRWYRRGRGT